MSSVVGSETSKMDALVLSLFDKGAVKFGEFTLKSGIKSPVYIDLRLTVSYPKLLQEISEAMYTLIRDLPMDIICGVPYTALPFATAISLSHDIPMCMARKEAKAYGTKKCIEGVFTVGQHCVIIEDLITSGTSIMETVAKLDTVGLKVSHAVVLIDRQQGGKENLKQYGDSGINCHSVLNISTVLDCLIKHKRITDESLIQSVRDFLAEHSAVKAPALSTKSKTAEPPSITDADAISSSSVKRKRRLSFESRAELTSNPIAQRLFKIMAKKRTNLCVSADVTSCAELLKLAESVGPYICCLKTHVDILSDFADQPDFTKDLHVLATVHDFVIFEDRKFADIGNTVMHQFDGGVYEISDWADIVNCHTVPGKGIIDGLRRVSEKRAASEDTITSSDDGVAAAASSLATTTTTKEKKVKHGLLLLAEMSSAHNLTGLPGYTDTSVEWAKENRDFVIGFISVRGLCLDDPGMISMTPGVNLKSKGDGIGQQYKTPDAVIGEKGSDIIIVGRGIYKSEDPVSSAKLYRDEAWQAYQNALGSEE